MTISNFTIPELDYLKEHCQFTGREQLVFDLRSQGASLYDIAYILGVSIDSVKKLSQRVNKKIIKAL